MRFLHDPLALLYFVPIFLITITVHEVAHAYVAWRLGDPTARAMGRITFNPLRHLDPFGFIMLMVLGFGWAKPVPINPRNFRNERAGMAMSALAGPASNILMCIAGVIIFHLIFRVAYAMENFNMVIIAALTFFYQFAMLNVWFATFNMIPIPPLDGSRIINYFLPPRLSYYYSYVERYGVIILMVLMYSGIFARRIYPGFPDLLFGPLSTVATRIFTWIFVSVGWIFGG